MECCSIVEPAGLREVFAGDVGDPQPCLPPYCKAGIPVLFAFNTALIVSAGLPARRGGLTAGWKWFKPWRTVTAETLADRQILQIQAILEGSCPPRRFRALICDCIASEDDGNGALAKKMAG